MTVLEKAIAKARKLRLAKEMAGYPSEGHKLQKLVMPDRLEKRAPGVDTLEKVLSDAGMSPQAICDSLAPLRKLHDAIAEQSADIDKCITKLEDRELVARHGRRGELVLQKRDSAQHGTLQKRAAAHKGNAENMAGDEIIDERGERHEVAELIKNLHQQGPDDLFKGDD